MHHTRLMIAAIFACVISTAVLAQETPAARQKAGTAVKQDSLRDGLKLIYSARDRHKEWEKDLDIDMEKLSATIEASVDRAMRSLDISLRHLDALDADIDIPEVDIPEIDIPEIHIPEIDIPEIDIRIPDIDIDHRFDRDDHRIHRDAHKVKEKEKSREKHKEEKRKGLVKIK